MSERREKLLAAIAGVESFLANSIAIRHGLLCALPPQAALYHLRKELADLDTAGDAVTTEEER